MRTLTFYDAAYPPSTPPATDGVCIYIGGDTPHVWTPAEIAAQPARYRLPIYVRSNPQAVSPRLDTADALRQLQAIGAPRGSLVAWDTETAADSFYMYAVYVGLQMAGYPLIDYGSQSRVFGNYVPDGYYWGADWTGTAHIAPGDVMTQYAAFRDYDVDQALPTLPFWDTHPVTLTQWQEKMMQQLPMLSQGASGTPVRTLQGLLAARGSQIVLDGIFGPQTKDAVEFQQSSAQITVDGIVGPQTWPALITPVR